MLQLYKKVILISCFIFSFVQTNATHIVGGELYYRLLPGGNNYEITLIIYRDCYTGNPPFDDPGSVGIFNANNFLVQQILVPVDPDSITIPPTINSPCFIPPTDVCYRRAFYTTVVNLPPIQGGYQLVYQRCCRNFSILNIINPLQTGITIYANIPSNTINADNSNPVYNNLPPPFICLGVPFEFDHSATDADLDSVAYELCTPFDGASLPNPMPQPPFNPPYPTVQWQAPFSLANLLGGIPLSIDPVTGILTATPNTIGQFVIGVCAKEYRNGILISTTRRDYQLNVVPCPSLVVAALQTPIISCGNNTVTFQNNSIGASTYFWNFGDPDTTADTSHVVNPTYTYPDTGSYTVTLIAYSTLNGCADTTTGIVHLYPAFNADFTFTQVPCSLIVNFNSTSQNTGSGFANIWQWNFDDNTTSNLQNPSHVYSNAGTYTVTLIVRSDSGCVDTIQKTVVLTQILNATTSIMQPVSCTGNCDASGTVTPTNGIPPYTYQWSDPNSQTTQTATGLCSGTYTVIVTDSDSCQVIKTITISDPPPLALSVLSTDAYCGGRCYGTATVNASGGTPPYSYIWNDPQNQTTQTATDLCPGVYTVLITDDHGCTLSDSVEVIFSNYIPPLDATVSDDTIFEGQTVQIISTVYTNGTYTWNPPSGLSSTTISNPTATPPVSFITYVVEYVDSNGCENRDSVNIVVKEVTCVEPELFIPNAFTPNADGTNDILYVRGNTIKELLIRVYDRWGEKVFETVNPGQGWDGTYKGKLVMPGVFDYYFEATCYNNEKFFKKGNVTVIR